MVSVVWPIFRPERRRRKHNSAVLQWESLVTPVLPSSGEQCMHFCSKDWAHQQPCSLQNTDFQFAVSGTMALVHSAQWLFQSHLDFEFDGMAETCVTPASLSWHLILAKTVKPRCQLYQKWYAVKASCLLLSFTVSSLSTQTQLRCTTHVGHKVKTLRYHSWEGVFASCKVHIWLISHAPCQAAGTASSLWQTKQQRGEIPCGDE